MQARFQETAGEAGSALGLTSPEARSENILGFCPSCQLTIRNDLADPTAQSGAAFLSRQTRFIHPSGIALHNPDGILLLSPQKTARKVGVTG